MVPGALTSFVTDAEVLQEILHRHLAIGRREEGIDLVHAFSRTMSGRIEPVQPADVVLAAELAREYPALSARDLLHLAVMRRLALTAMVSADRGFDGIEGLRRLDPLDLDSWAVSEGLRPPQPGASRGDVP